MTSIYENLCAKILIKKTKYFGIVKKYALIVVIPSLKIAKIETNIENFPFTEKEILIIEKLKDFTEKNKYKVKYYTNNKKLKRILDSHDFIF